MEQRTVFNFGEFGLRKTAMELVSYCTENYDKLLSGEDVLVKGVSKDMVEKWQKMRDAPPAKMKKTTVPDCVDNDSQLVLKSEDYIEIYQVTFYHPAFFEHFLLTCFGYSECNMKTFFSIKKSATLSSEEPVCEVPLPEDLKSFAFYFAVNLLQDYYAFSKSPNTPQNIGIHIKTKNFKIHEKEGDLLVECDILIQFGLSIRGRAL